MIQALPAIYKHDKGVNMPWNKMALVVLPALALVLVAAPTAPADPVLTVSNGNFAQYSGTTPGTTNDTFENVKPTGWTATGTPASNSNLIFITNQAGVNNNSLYLQVYNTKSPSGTAPFPAPAPGGNFVEADGNPSFEESFSYQLHGLTPGQTYQLSFYQAAGQQQGFNGDTTNRWIVGLGTPGGFNVTPIGGGFDGYSLVDPNGSVAVSPLMSVPTGDYVPWEEVTVTLKADSTDDLLTFLAWGDNGNTANLPPMAFLDIANNGAAATPVPEPSTLALTAVGVFGLGLVYLRQRRARLAAV